jgi:hypothetical protein
MPVLGLRSISTEWMLRLILQMWNRIVARTQNQELKAEVTSLQENASSKSIWKMNKAKLVETARMELGMTSTQAEKQTVTSLRERLRSQRDVTQAITNPNAKLPSGLEKMLKEELIAECEKRELPVPTEKNTRAKMICLIRDQVDYLQIDTPSTTAQNRSTPGTSSTGPSVDNDWEMPAVESKNRRQR